MHIYVTFGPHTGWPVKFQQFLYEEYAYALQTNEQILQLQMAAQAAQQAQQAQAKEGEAPKVEDIPDMNLDDDKKE